MSSDSRARPGLVSRLRARPRLLAAALVALVAAVAFVLWWFEPQALLFDRVVDEEFPAAEAAPAAKVQADGAETGDADRGHADEPSEPRNAELEESGDAQPRDTDDDGEVTDEEEIDEPAEPRPLSTGTFASRNRYTVTGDATVYELPDGARTLRLESFESTNGPDLFVYLTRADHADDDGAMGADFVDLGLLQGNIGNQNYDIPGEVDLDVYDTVVIWCRRFSVSFGAADLAASEPEGG